MSVRFQLYGGVSANVDGAELPIGGPRPRSLLAMLLLDVGRATSVTALIDGVWEPADLPLDAPAAVQVTISRLRRVLGEHGVTIASRSGAYELESDQLAVDVLAAEQRLALAAAADVRASAEWRRLAEEAVHLTEGTPLSGVDAPFAPTARAYLEAVRLRAVTMYADACFASRRTEGLATQLASELRAHPTNEGLTARMMRVLAVDGRPADALDAYEACRHELRDRLGVDPSAELRELHRQLLRGELDDPFGAPPARPESPQVPALRGRPQRVSAFIGREAERRELRELMQSRRLVTVKGPGGRGKTSLTVEVCDGLVAQHRDGGVFVDLSSLVTGDAVPTAVLRAMQLPDQPGETSSEQLRRVVADRDLLLVLDNCEHLVDAVATLVHEVLSSSSTTRVVCTSRVPLDIAGERIYPLPALSGGDEGDAARLLRQRVEDAGVATQDWRPGEAAELAARLGFNALAIELAARRCVGRRPSEIVEQIDEGGLDLAGPKVGPRRHRTVRALVEWSLDLLDDADRELAETLAVFAGDFTSVAAQAVAAGGREVLPSLERLVAASIATVDRSGGVERYRLHVPVREVVWAGLDDARRHELRRRLGAFLLGRADAARDRLAGPDQRAVANELANDVPDIRSLLAADDVDAVGDRAALAASVWPIFAYLGQPREMLYRLRSIAGDTSAGDPVDVELAIGTATLAAEVGDDALAMTARARAVEIARTARDRYRALAICPPVLNVLEPEGLTADLRQAIELAERAEDEHAAAIARLRLADLLRGRLGQFAEARVLAHEAAAVLRRLGDLRNLALALIVEEYAAVWTGDLGAGPPLLEEARAAARASGDVLMEMRLEWKQSFDPVAWVASVPVSADVRDLYERSRAHGGYALARIISFEAAERFVHEGPDHAEEARAWLDEAIRVHSDDGPERRFVLALDAVNRLVMGEPPAPLIEPLLDAIERPFRTMALLRLLLPLSAALGDRETLARVTADIAELVPPDWHRLTPWMSEVLGDEQPAEGRVGETASLEHAQRIGRELVSRLATRESRRTASARRDVPAS